MRVKRSKSHQRNSKSKQNRNSSNLVINKDKQKNSRNNLMINKSKQKRNNNNLKKNSSLMKRSCKKVSQVKLRKLRVTKRFRKMTPYQIMKKISLMREGICKMSRSQKLLNH